MKTAASSFPILKATVAGCQSRMNYLRKNQIRMHSFVHFIGLTGISLIVKIPDLEARLENCHKEILKLDTRLVYIASGWLKHLTETKPDFSDIKQVCFFGQFWIKQFLGHYDSEIDEVLNLAVSQFQELMRIRDDSEIINKFL